jgi:6-phosphogluconolactonase
LVVPSREALGRRGAELFAESSRHAIAERGVFRAALSGGSTPRRLYELLGSEEYIGRVDWNKVELFWGDERCVPPQDEQSNFRMADAALLHKIPAAVHRISGELSPEAAARQYEDDMHHAFGLKSSGELPRFDLVLLGMGEDGHTASLFPGSEALDERARLAVPVTGREQARVTLTLPVLNNAIRTLFLVTGEAKAAVVRDILEGDNPRGYPAGMVSPHDGEVTWLLDRAAASMLMLTGLKTE